MLQIINFSPSIYYLPVKQQLSLHALKAVSELGVVACAFNLNTWEAEVEADGSCWVQDRFDPYGEFQAN